MTAHAKMLVVLASLGALELAILFSKHELAHALEPILKALGS